MTGCAKKEDSSSTTTSAEVTAPPTVAADSSASATPVAVISSSPAAGTGSASPAAVAFTDIHGNFAEKAIVALGQLGVLDATTGAFQPQKPILRREFARWLFKTNNAVFADAAPKLIHPAESGDKSDFSDLKSSDPDFAFIEGLDDAGISVGFPDKTFKADQPLTHEQAIAMKAGLDRGGVADRYKDPEMAILGIPDWKDKHSIAKTFLPALATDHSDDEIGGLKTRIDNVGRAFGAVAMFRPQEPVTRAQAAMLLQVIGAHTQDTNTPNEPRTVDAALHPKPSPTP